MESSQYNIDQLTAASVREAVKELNDAIARATRQGLRVEVGGEDADDIDIVNGVYWPRVEVRVSRPL